MVVYTIAVVEDQVDEFKESLNRYRTVEIDEELPLDTYTVSGDRTDLMDLVEEDFVTGFAKEEDLRFPDER